MEANGENVMPIWRAITQLQPNDADYRFAIRNWMYSRVPITETQTSLRSILTSHPLLEAEYSSFLTHSTATQADCEAARQELGRLMNIPVYDFPAGAPTVEETAALLARIEERLGEAKYELFTHTYLMRLRNSDKGIPTRHLLLKILEDDAEALHVFQELWPKEKGEENM